MICQAKIKEDPQAGQADRETVTETVKGTEKVMEPVQRLAVKKEIVKNENNR